MDGDIGTILGGEHGMGVICRLCKEPMAATDSYCCKCGARVILVRSENEMKAEYLRLQSLLSTVPNLPTYTIVNAMLMTLDWTSGGKMSPSEAIDQALKAAQDFGKGNNPKGS